MGRHVLGMCGSSDSVPKTKANKERRHDPTLPVPCVSFCLVFQCYTCVHVSGLCIQYVYLGSLSIQFTYGWVLGVFLVCGYLVRNSVDMSLYACSW